MGNKMNKMNKQMVECIEKYVSEHPSLGYYLTKDKKYVANINSTKSLNQKKTINHFYNLILPKEYKEYG